jgi:hypothetical protein
MPRHGTSHPACGYTPRNPAPDEKRGTAPTTREKDTRFDRSHFLKHGTSSLEIESVYYVLSADYNRYMDIQQSVNLDIHRRFGDEGIAFAVTTQNMVFARAAQALEEKSREPSQRHEGTPEGKQARRKSQANGMPSAQSLRGFAAARLAI